ncbi:MAG: hypothetical protein PHD71_07565 [Methanospirillum sp.]|nr:hypothetical protein [Methanospirillum sp.]
MFFDQIQKEAASNEKLKQAAQANDKDKFGFALKKELKKIIEGRTEKNEKIVTKFFEGGEFRNQVEKYIIDNVYEEIMTGE